MMTESYSPADVIKKYYGSGAKDGAHLPFNFQMINDIKATSKAMDFVNMVNRWSDVVPDGKVTNWVVSEVLIKIMNHIKNILLNQPTDWQS